MLSIRGTVMLKIDKAVSQSVAIAMIINELASQL